MSCDFSSPTVIAIISVALPASLIFTASSIALGMVKPDIATTGQKLKIDILGKMYDATILDESPYDPENNLLRA